MTYVHFAVKACLSNGTFPHSEPAHRVSSLLSLGIHASVQYVRVEAEPCAQGSDKEGVGYQESELSEEDPRRHDQNKGQPSSIVAAIDRNRVVLLEVMNVPF